MTNDKSLQVCCEKPSRQKTRRTANVSADNRSSQRRTERSRFTNNFKWKCQVLSIWHYNKEYLTFIRPSKNHVAGPWTRLKTTEICQLCRSANDLFYFASHNTTVLTMVLAKSYNDFQFGQLPSWIWGSRRPPVRAFPPKSQILRDGCRLCNFNCRQSEGKRVPDHWNWNMMWGLMDPQRDGLRLNCNNWG